MFKNTGLQTFRSLKSTICASCLRSQAARPFSQTTTRNSLDKSLDSMMSNVSQGLQPQTSFTFYNNMIPSASAEALRNLAVQDWPVDDRHKLHIYATKHNCHITLAKPNRDALMSLSCGNIGFRKAGRGTYDAAYQLAAFTMSRIQDKGFLAQISKLELVFREYGPGREAVTKAILSPEGQKIRPLIVKLSDATRLKFGGTRSRKPRRLG